MSLSALLRSRTAHAVLGCVVSAALIIWLCVAIEWQEVWRALGAAHYIVFLPAGAVMVVHYLLRAWRWRYLLPAGAPPPRLLTLLDAIMVGSFATYILPLRAGEFIRPLLLTRHTNCSFPSAFVSVVIERFFDLAFVLLSFALIVPLVPGLPAWSHQGALVLSGLAGAILIFMIAGSVAPGPLARLNRSVTALFPPALGRPLCRFADELLEGTRVIRHVRRLMMIVVLTTLVWLSCYLLFGVFLYLFDVPATAVLSVTIGVIIALAVAAPSAPGFLGVYQVACIAAFSLFGLPEETAVAYSLVTHAFQYLLFVGWGVVYLTRHNLRLAELQSSARQPQP